MKYKVGDKTVLGQIISVQRAYPTDRPEEDYAEYIVDGKVDNHTFQEFEIDAIIIKPKRNIDHLIELIEARKREEAVAFIDYDHNRNAPWSNLTALLHPYAEPFKYPKLTPEELKAVKWLVDGGYEEIVRDGGAYACYGKLRERVHASVKINPVSKCLEGSAWITTEPINLAELLAAQEEKIN